MNITNTNACRKTYLGNPVNLPLTNLMVTHKSINHSLMESTYSIWVTVREAVRISNIRL